MALPTLPAADAAREPLVLPLDAAGLEAIALVGRRGFLFPYSVPSIVPDGPRLSGPPAAARRGEWQTPAAGAQSDWCWRRRAPASIRCCHW